MTTSFRALEQAHRRQDPLTGRHVLVSPHRGARPWQGGSEKLPASVVAAHDPNCYLCAGNHRAGGIANPSYTGVYVFENDFPAVNREIWGDRDTQDPLFRVEPACGTSRVLCFSPDHSASLPLLTATAMRDVVETWCVQTEELGRDNVSVQLFENKGEMMGASSPHPHGQIWATTYVPDELIVEDEHQRRYFIRNGRALLDDVVDRELGGERVVEVNEYWLAIVPFWARWPFETLLLPRFAVARLPELEAAARVALAAIVQALTTRYDNLFETPFPYSMGWHGAPFDSPPTVGWRLHAHFYPPLLRSATVRKFMVGFELLAEAQRDLTPERAAERLRAVSAVHYSKAVGQ